MKNLSFRVDEDLSDKLDKVAEYMGQTKNQCLRDLVEFAYENIGDEPTKEEWNSFYKVLEFIEECNNDENYFNAIEDIREFSEQLENSYRENFKYYKDTIKKRKEYFEKCRHRRNFKKMGIEVPLDYF